MSSRLPRADDATDRRSAVLAVLVALGLVLLTLVAGSLAGLVGLLSALSGGQSVESLGPLLLVALVLPTESVYLGVAVAYAHLRDLPVPVRRPGRRDLGVAAAGSVVAVAAGLVVLAVGDAVGVGPVSSALDPAAETDPRTLLVLVPLSLLVVAPAEEAFFRGVVQGRLRRAVGVVPSVAVASVLFWAVHVFNFVGFELTVGVLVPLAAIFCAALVLGAVYELTANLVVPVVVHGMYNSAMAVVSYLAVTGVV
jgi:hypothetical protein